MSEGSDGAELAPAESGAGKADENPQMKVYIKPGCPWCIAAVNWLDDEGYDYNKVDVISNADAFNEMRELSGQTLAPTMTYGSLLLADFGVPELEEFVEKHGIVPED